MGLGARELGVVVKTGFLTVRKGRGMGIGGGWNVNIDSSDSVQRFT